MKLQSQGATAHLVGSKPARQHGSRQGALGGLAAAVLVLAGSAPALAADEATAGKQCFWPSSVNGFNPVDDRRVNLRVGVNDVYQLELLGPCPDIKWTENLALDTRGSSMVCTGLDVTVISPSSIGPQRCPARTLRKLSAEEVKAMSRSKP